VTCDTRWQATNHKQRYIHLHDESALLASLTCYTRRVVVVVVVVVVLLLLVEVVVVVVVMVVVVMMMVVVEDSRIVHTVERNKCSGGGPPVPCHPRRSE
jgi:hypothetical protein